MNIDNCGNSVPECPMDTCDIQMDANNRMLLCGTTKLPSESSDSEHNPSKRIKIDWYFPDTANGFGNQLFHDIISHYQWFKVNEHDETPHRFPFSTGKKKPGSQITADLSEPIEFFSLFFTDGWISHCVDVTNRHAQNKLGNVSECKSLMWSSWKDVTVSEMKAFLGILLQMGLMPLRRFSDFWLRQYTGKKLMHSNVFTKTRFSQIYWMFHVNDFSDKHVDHVKATEDKIYQFVNFIDDKFRTYFIPDREVAVCKSLINTNGQVCFGSFDTREHPTWCGQLHVISDCKTGYVCGIEAYYKHGATSCLERPGFSLASGIVLNLCQKLLDSIPNAMGYHLFLDRYYTNMKLTKELLRLKCHMTGTIYRNQDNIPNEIVQSDLKEGETLAYRHENYLLVSWNRKELVTMLTTWDTAECSTVNKEHSNSEHAELPTPAVVANYLKHIQGLDQPDLYPASYCFIGSKYIWWRKLFTWVLDVAITNSYILYKLHRKPLKPLNRTEFVKKLISQLVSDVRAPVLVRTRPQRYNYMQRLNGKLHIIDLIPENKKKLCMVCSSNDIDYETVRTKFFCRTCPWKPGLHVGICFEIYHTNKKFRNDLCMRARQMLSSGMDSVSKHKESDVVKQENSEETYPHYGESDTNFGECDVDSDAFDLSSDEESEFVGGATIKIEETIIKQEITIEDEEFV